jgi:hypothetical protein
MPTLPERLNRLRFDLAVQAMRATPPVARGARPFTALSMVRRSDVHAYLLALKTFAHHAGPERVVVIADPTLGEDDAALIRRHAPHAEILPAAQFRHPALPTGGCWERLSAIAQLSAETSIVQLDADTVTFGEPTEVLRAVRENRSFVLRAEPEAEIVGLAAAAADGRARLQTTSHIQAAAEARLDELNDPAAFRYIRGCAGFAGFARGALSPERLRDVSAQLRAIHRERWDEWGTEQVTSNLLAASAPGAFALPHPRYCNADGLTPATVLAHYIGYIRFRTRDYEERARAAARLLRRLEPA